MRGGVEYVSKASSTGNKTFAQKIADVSAAFSALTADEKLRSILVLGSNAVFRYSGGSRNAYKFESDTCAIFDFTNQKYFTQTSPSASYTDQSTTSNSNGLILYVLEYN